MNERDRAAVDAAKGKRKSTGNGRAAESAQTAGSTLQGKLTQVSDRLAENMKQQIVASAVVKVLQDFENGDFGALADEMFTGLAEGINSPLEVECQVLSAWQDSPKYVLPESTISSSVS